MSDDNISHPQHYIAPNGVECIDVIEAFGLGFALGNAIKYILRAGKKGERTEDLRKARWYIEREISGRAPSSSHTDLMLRGWQDCALGAEAERDKLRAEVLHLRALIAEHTDDETRWREWASSLACIDELGANVSADDSTLQRIISSLVHPSAHTPKRKRKAKK